MCVCIYMYIQKAPSIIGTVRLKFNYLVNYSNSCSQYFLLVAFVISNLILCIIFTTSDLLFYNFTPYSL